MRTFHLLCVNQRNYLDKKAQSDQEQSSYLSLTASPVSFINYSFVTAATALCERGRLIPISRCGRDKRANKSND
nr:MAG TPA: hypothetical protein [Caudoviricetes sp.]